MKFNDLSNEEKQQLHLELTANATSVGGVNFFLKILEDIRSEKPKPLLNKDAVWNCANAKLVWTKSIYKETLSCLIEAMRKEERDGDMINGLKPKDYKSTMNMMKALRPVRLTITPKKVDNAQGFSFDILDPSQDKKTKVTLMFKIIFFYNVDFAKDVLNYKAEEA